MKTNLKRVLTVAGFAAALSLAALPLAAQQASFDLPMTAHWGRAVLVPGHYTITGPTNRFGVGIMYIRGSQGTQLAVPEVSSSEPNYDSNYLRLVNAGGVYVVREFVSGASGQTYLFAIPKTLRLQMSPQKGHQVATLIKVAGK